KGEKEDPDTHRITRKAGPTGGSEFNANRGSGFSANQHPTTPFAAARLPILVFRLDHQPGMCGHRAVNLTSFP
ncbi:hypothetical protein, partial [Paraburkholderia graminis]|uniref:hypothetical protein n=1 Tax=Paraburkholderia graminis TaxID=60548 RepID=UPI001C2DF7B8